MLPLHHKLYWKAKNAYQANVKYRNVKGHGLLEHREDINDWKATELLGGLWDKPKPKYADLFNANDWQFNQSGLNICVFASSTMAWSFQEGKRFSVRAGLIQGVLNGDVSGNGFSSLRGGMKVLTGTGALPIEYLDDTVTDWNTYKQNVLTPEMRSVMSQYKSPGYYRVTTVEEAVQLIERGHCLLTAIKWKSAMNNPAMPEFYLISSGYDIGGHAIYIQGYRASGEDVRDWYNRQTFGAYYGVNGTAWLQSLFASGFPVYVLEKNPNRTDEQRIKGRLEGMNVKGSKNAIYRIENGVKRGYVNMQVFGKQHFYSVSDETLEVFPEGDLIQ